MAEKIALSGQSLLDLAILLAGSAEAAFDLALENGMSLTDEVAPGQVVRYSGAAVSKQVAQYFAANRLQPATAISAEDNAGGVGYWAIGINFFLS